MNYISNHLRWEASACERPECRATVIHELRGEPKLNDGDVCPACNHHSMKVIHNPSVIANIVYATRSENEPK